MFFVKQSVRLTSCATLLFATLVCACASAQDSKKDSTQESTEVDVKKVSQGFGHFIGKNLKSSGLNFDTNSFIQGIKDGLDGKPAPMPEKEYERQMMLLQEQTFKRLAQDNMKAAEEFLKKNVKEAGVVEIEPGKLQYIIVKKGTGAEVKDNQAPQIQYTGKYIDGTVFGSSQDTGGPITVHLDQTIPGFSSGLKGMKEGEVRKIFVHPDLGYGKSGNLPPNSLLIFEVELLKADNPDADDEDDLSLADEENGDEDGEDDDEGDDEDENDDEDEEDEKTPAPATKTMR